MGAEVQMANDESRRFEVLAREPQRMILMPAVGLRARELASTRPQGRFLEKLTTGRPVSKRRDVGLRVVDSIADDGPKLVEIAPDQASALRAAQPGLRLVPLRYYSPASRRFDLRQRLTLAAPGRSVVMDVVVTAAGVPVVDAEVLALFDGGDAAGGYTTSDGTARLRVPSGVSRLDALYVFPLRDFWGFFRRRVAVVGRLAVALQPIRLEEPDVVRSLYGSAALEAGRGVRVGIVDTGVGPHPGLRVAGGRNTVLGEDPEDFHDNGDQHGTHVAGIVAARGKALRGLAPGVTLRSYRVFGEDVEGASNYDIAKAIDAAVTDRCDILNLSLGMQIDPDEVDETDDALRAAVQHARDHGVLVIAAAGNDGRAPVSFPAFDDLCLAVSAMGRKGTFPAGTPETDDVAAPYGTDRLDFIAAFSNVGPEIDLVGPGVGVVSTVAPDGYAVMSGTSMAAPAVCGAAARLLAGRAVMKARRDAARSAEMAKVVLAAARTLGFKPVYEGRGLLP